jgi:hypothetical protein
VSEVNMDEPLPHTCQAIQTDRDTQEQRECGKSATHTAHEPPIYFCSGCLHECMQDGTLEDLRSGEGLAWAISIADECAEREDMGMPTKGWRRVLLPMLLEEANKRGLDVG